MSLFEGITLQVNQSDFGPPLEVDPEHKFASIPFALFSKSDRLGRVCDWTASTRREPRFTRRPDRNAGDAPAVFTFEAADDEGFELVDSKPIPKANKWGPKNRGGGAAGGRGGQQGGPGQRRDARDAAAGVSAGARSAQNSQQGARKSLREKDQADRRNWERNKAPRIRDFSVTITPEWQLKSEIAFSALSRLSHVVGEPEDLVSTGSTQYFNRSFDVVASKSDKRLAKAQWKQSSPCSLLDDPIIQKLASEGKGNVFATDLVLSVLMAAPRSLYSWDIVVMRAGENLFLFSRDDSNLDAITVNETAHELPDDDAKDALNSATNLDNEAYAINKAFQEHVVQDQPTFHAQGAADGGDTPSLSDTGKVYRYRRWKLEVPRAPEDEEVEYNSLIVRCEIDAVTVTKDGKDALLTVRTLNEFDPRAKDGVDWRQKIDTQPGAVLTYCLKNNSSKVARYTCQALLAGSDLIKIGFVSRVRPQDNKQHVVLGVKTYKPPEFARQMDVNIENVWGIIKGIVDNCMLLPEGQYVLAKDPNKPIIRMYQVPDDAFDQEEEAAVDEDEEEED